MKQFTKGGWKAKRNALGTWTIQTELEHIGQIDRHFNAHLISASPDLYEALKELDIAVGKAITAWANGENYIGVTKNILLPALDKGREAIAKAEGKS